MATLRGPGTVASKRRSGTAGDIPDKALTAIDTGFVRHGARFTVRLASSCEGEASFGITRLYHNVQPSDSDQGARQGYRLNYDGIGLVNPFAAVLLYKGVGCPLRSVESSTQLLLVPDLAWY
jgi:hypothetical protein